MGELIIIASSILYLFDMIFDFILRYKKQNKKDDESK